MKFRDYYEILGVERDASADDITKAYRKLARTLHPDINKAADAEDKFKELNEAHEVLKDADTRQRYDTLGANFKNGQDFQPPPDWADMFQQFGGNNAGGPYGAPGGGAPGGGFSFQSGGAAGRSGFSDFFDMLLGGLGGMGGGMNGGMGGGFSSNEHAAPFGSAASTKGANVKADINVSLRDAYHGAEKTFSVAIDNYQGNAIPERRPKSFKVKIPPGMKHGGTIRLTGQGSASPYGGPAGDLLLKVRIAPDNRFRVKGKNIYTTVRLSPWEMALGAKVPIDTLGGKITISVPPGSQGGSKLRLRGKGMPQKSGAGDLLVELKVVVPKTLNNEERALFERLAETSTFKPREA